MNSATDRRTEVRGKRLWALYRGGKCVRYADGVPMLFAAKREAAEIAAMRSGEISPVRVTIYIVRES